jgi:thymidylate synthase (FAD)
MVEFKFHVKLPIFVARQWIRHRTANVNEYSGRYSEMKDEFYIPDIEQIRTQSSTNRQSRGEDSLPDDISTGIISKMQETQSQLYTSYKDYLEDGLARELARINLPLSAYTEWYWKIDLHNLLHFLRLRLDHHAQYEIQVYAEKIGEIVKLATPMVWEAFEDYILNSLSFSRQELDYIRSIAGSIKADDDEELAKFSISGLEAKEFRDKLQRLQ